MMEAAKAHQIRLFGLAAIGPVVDMVGIDVLCVRAAGETAAFVAGVEGAA